MFLRYSLVACGQNRCIARAAETASAKPQEYLALAEAAALTDTINMRIVRILSDESDLLTAESVNAQAKKVIEDRIGRLELFTQIAAAVASDLREQLKSGGDPSLHAFLTSIRGSYACRWRRQRRLHSNFRNVRLPHIRCPRIGKVQNR